MEDHSATETSYAACYSSNFSPSRTNRHTLDHEIAISANNKVRRIFAEYVTVIERGGEGIFLRYSDTIKSPLEIQIRCFFAFTTFYQIFQQTLITLWTFCFFFFLFFCCREQVGAANVLSCIVSFNTLIATLKSHFSPRTPRL